MSAVDELLRLVAEQKAVARGEQLPETKDQLEKLQNQIVEQQAVLAALEQEKADRKTEYEVGGQLREMEVKRIYNDRRAKSSLVDADYLRRVGSALWLYGEARKHKPTLKPVEQTWLHKEWKAMNTADSGYGTEWVPTGMSSALYDVFNLPVPEIQVFPRVPMPTDPYLLTTKAGRTTAYVIGENTTITASDLTSAQVSLATVKLAGRTTFSYELDEDGIFDMTPIIVADISYQIADGFGDGIQNGDTSQTHQDYDTANDAGVANLPAANMSGLRYAALNKNTAAGAVDVSGAKTLAGFRLVREKLGAFGVNPMNLALFVSPDVYIDALSITEVETIDQFGPGATIRSGALAMIDGTPVYVSENVRADLSATGVNGETSNTYSCYVYAYVPAWVIGYRRNLMFEMDRVITSQSFEVVGSQRCIFSQRSAATDQTAAIGYKW